MGNLLADDLGHAAILLAVDDCLTAASLLHSPEEDGILPKLPIDSRLATRLVVGSDDIQEPPALRLIGQILDSRSAEDARSEEVEPHKLRGFITSSEALKIDGIDRISVGAHAGHHRNQKMKSITIFRACYSKK